MTILAEILKLLNTRIRLTDDVVVKFGCDFLYVSNLMYIVQEIQILTVTHKNPT
jgi:hypothetical protein